MSTLRSLKRCKSLIKCQKAVLVRREQIAVFGLSKGRVSYSRRFMSVDVDAAQYLHFGIFYWLTLNHFHNNDSSRTEESMKRNSQTTSAAPSHNSISGKHSALLRSLYFIFSSCVCASFSSNRHEIKHETLKTQRHFVCSCGAVILLLCTYISPFICK